MYHYEGVENALHAHKIQNNHLLAN